MSLIFQSQRVSFYSLCRMCALVHDPFFIFFSILTETSYTHSLARKRTTLHNTPQFGFTGNSFVSHIFTCNDAISFPSFENGSRWRRYFCYVILKLCKETLTFKDDDHQQDEKERKFILHLSPEKLEVEPSPDRKVIKLVTLDNLLLSLQLLKHVVK